MNYFLICKGRRVLWYADILILCLTFTSAFANSSPPFKLTIQQQKISGIITDATGALPGVTIMVRGKAISTISDVGGNYSIEANLDDVLIFIYVGFKTIEIPIDGQNSVNAVMIEETTTLEGITINAGYYNVKQAESTGSISRITSATIEKQPVTNILATMQGRMAGVNVTQETGVAGGGFAISIRGINSLRTNGNAPLYVIDGVPYSSDPISSTQTSLAIPGDGNPLSSINPNDIESLEILKDADATAIYGSRGANGVVLVTTKKGKAGKTTFTINTSHGIGNVSRMMDIMNTSQYLAMRNNAFINDGVSPESYDYDVNGTWSTTRNTDWQKKLIGGTSEIDSYQASASGGSEHTKFLLSGNYRTETTVFPGDSKYSRGGALVSIDHTSDDQKFQLTFSGRYTAQDNNLPATDYTTLSRTLAPNAPELYDADGNLNWENSTWENPLSQSIGSNISKTYDLITNAVVSYACMNGLTLKSNIGFTDLHNDDSRALPSTMYDPAYGLGSEYSTIYANSLSRKSWTIEPQLNWKHTFGKSKLDILLGATFQNQDSKRLVYYAYGFASNSLINDLTSANTLQVTNNEELTYKYQAFFGRVNYTLADRYIVNLTGRRDGSSRFGPGKQFATFGAVGIAWLFYKEHFIANNASVLSFGKLRGSYGTTGNDQIGDYQFLDTYMSSGYNYQGINGLMPIRLYNSDFGWETNKKLEVAMEAGFFKDRIFFTSAWYRNRSGNQLVGIPLPGTTGFNSIQSNLNAVVENSGTEFTLKTVNIQNDKFTWTTSVNLTLPKSRLISFPGLESSTYKNTFVIGKPITIKKLYHYTGVNSQTGLYEFEDADGDGAITSANDRTSLVDFSPEFYGGLQNQLNYKQWQLDFLFQFVKQVNYNSSAQADYAGSMRNQPVGYTNAWMQPDDIASYQLYTTGLNQDATQASARYLQSDAVVSDASYIRLKNVSLSYDFPEQYFQNFRCRLSLQGQNLLTITQYDGADPEFKDIGFLPPLRIISFGVQLTF